DVEWLYTGGPIARGGYFYKQGQGGGTLRLPTIAEDGGNGLAAESGRGAVRHEVGPDNRPRAGGKRLGGPPPFLIRLRPPDAAGGDDKGEWSRVPATKTWTTTTWFAGPSRLSITGGTRIWGPWGETRAQVWDGSLAAKETRKVVLKLGTPSAEEAEKVAALSA